MPRCLTFGIHHPINNLCHEATRRAFLRIGILLCRRQVEDQVGLNQSTSIWLVQKDELFVLVARNIFILKFSVKTLVDAQVSPVSLRKDEIKLGWCDAVDSLGMFGHAGALLRKAFHANNLCRGEGARPFGNKYMVLKVGGNNIGDG